MYKRICKYLILLMFLMINILYAADPLSLWNVKRIDSTVNLYGVAYGNSAFVAVGDKGTVFYSRNYGSDWVNSQSLAGVVFQDVIFGGNKFIAVGGDHNSEITLSKIIKSNYGSDWIDISPGSNSDISGAAYGNGKCIAVGDLGMFFSSDTSWSEDGSKIYSSIVYGESTFVALDNYGGIIKSSDGDIWSPVSPGIPIDINSITYGNGKFIAVGTSGNIYYSLDKGDSWSTVAAAGWGGLYGVGCGDTTFVAVGDTGTVITSPDCINWTIRDSNITERLLGVTFGNRNFVAVGKNGTIIQSSLPSIPLDTTVNILDSISPVIDTASFGFLNNGEDSYVTVMVTDNIALKKGVFLVKKNGVSNNAYDTIYSEEGLSILRLTRAVKIPKVYITPRGLSYKIIATDWVDNKKEVTGYLSVKVKDYIVPFPTWTWKMISFPLILENKNIDSALGPLENRRVYRWNPVKKEYSNDYDTAVDPGDALWLKIKDDNVPDPLSIKVTGFSVDPGNVPVVSLPPGWSQIADPYAYNVASSKIKVKQDTVEIYVSDTANIWLENQFITYDYDDITGKKTYSDLVTILPNIGLWVKNRSEKDLTVIFPVFDADNTGSMAVNSPSHKVKNDGWGVKLKVMSKDYIDSDNYIGFLPGAKNGYDFNDLSEPPPVESYVSLYFPHPDWGKDSGRYRTDYRACGTYGALEITNYDFVVETNVRDKTTLTWDFINPPLNCRITLFDKKEGKNIDLASVKEYIIDWQDSGLKRDFSLAIEWDNIYLLNSIEISDINSNNIIDGEDLSILGLFFGRMQGENRWDPKVDLNKDKIIDGSDLYILGNSFGKNY